MLIGSLVLSSNSPPNPHLGLGDGEHGQHVPGRQNGVWWLKHTDMVEDDLYLPHRDKHTRVLTRAEDPQFRTKLLDQLSTVDAKWGSLTQSQKYYKVQDAIGGRNFVAAVNTAGDHGSWAFFTNGVPLHFYGVWDGISVQLVWADMDIGAELRSASSPRLWLYRLPVIHHRPLFIKTQAVCSKWWKWISADHRGDYFRSFNALELFLFGLGNRL